MRDKKKTPVARKPAALKRAKRVLSAAEPAPFEILNPRGEGSGLVICDHAGNRVPKALKGLGISKKDLQRHIGWDIGTADVGRHIGKELDMPVILSTYSRLVTDLNRAPHHPECVLGISDGTPIPANTGLSKKDKDQRLKEIFWPYQEQVAKQVTRLTKKKDLPVLLAIHSFTGEMGGVKRPWHIAVLWNKQEKIAKRLIAEIRKKHPNLLVGGNEPYTLKDERFFGSTICRHAEERGLPYVFVEFRQDLIDTKEKATQWADIFLQALAPVLEELPTLHERKLKK